MHGFEDKSARAECRIGLKVPGKECLIFTGTCEGSINNPKGQGNFGWDPIFRPRNQELSFAEMPIEEKNEVSHRGNAMKLLIDYFRSNPDWFNSS